jgi:hypothetical protein
MNEPIIKKIFYEKNATFKIIPHLSQTDLYDYKTYVLELQKNYQELYQQDCFFWDLDGGENSIIINENSYTVTEILNQLIFMTCWLYDKKYYIKGSFHYRINNIIEYIATDGKNKFFSHYILIDDTKIEDFYENDSNIEEVGTKIIIDAKNKIRKCIKFIVGSKSIKNEKSKKKRKDNHVLYTVVDYDKKEGNNLIIQSMQERIIQLENKQKSQVRMNKIIFKICTMISLLTASTFIYFSFQNRKHQL